MKRILSLLLALALVLSLAGCVFSLDFEDPYYPSSTAPTKSDPTDPGQDETEPPINEFGSYNSKEDVALYLHTYGRLPRNYYTKSEAKNKGWGTSGIDRYEEHAAIGGDTFGNREGLLPSKAGRKYTECDINTWGKTSRGAERIVFSNDGLVYYTSDHYRSFTLLYGDPDA